MLSETRSIPAPVIKHVSKQLGLSPTVLEDLHNPPSMRAATFEAIRTYLGSGRFKPQMKIICWPL